MRLVGDLPRMARPWVGALTGALLGGTMILSPWAPVVLLLLGLGAVLVFLRPALLVVTIFAGMLFDQAGLSSMKVATLPVTASKLSVLAALGGWTAICLVKGRRPIRAPLEVAGMLVFVASVGLSTAAVGNFWTAIFNLAGMAMLTVLVVLVCSILAEEDLRLPSRLIALLLVLVLALSAWGMRGGGRFSGTMGDPNEWATLLLLLTPALLGALATDRGSLPRLLRVALLLLAPVGILASQSRAAFLVGVLSAPAWLYLLRSQRGELWLAVSGAAGAAAALLDLDAVTARVRTLVATLSGRAEVDASLGERAELQRQAWDLFRDHWLLGAGPGNFPRLSGFVPVQGGLLPPHNTYLEVASEQGVVGLFALLVMAGGLLRALVRGRAEARSEARRNALSGLLIGLLAFGLMAATLGLLTFSLAYLLVGLGLALRLRAPRADDGL